MPEGKFDLVYSDASLEMPPRPGDRASYGDKLAYRKYVDEIEKRRRHNTKVKQERNAWFLKGNHEYFELITQSMMKTNPGLRETLRDRFYLAEGRYDGVGALKHVQAWIGRLYDSYSQTDFYDEILNRAGAKRLPLGCSERVFSAAVRRLVQEVIP